MADRATVIQALGLKTYLNELSAGDGSLKKAENVNIDEKGVITQRRGFNDYGSSLSSSVDRVSQIFEYKDRLLRHFNSSVQFDNGSGTFSNFSGTYTQLESGLRIKYQESNSNMYFTTDSGIKKISAVNASSFTTASDFILDSGVPKAIDITAKIAPDVAGFLPPQSKTAYRVLFGYKDANNNLLYGYPSSRYVLTNNSKTIYTYEKSSITVSAYATITASQYIIVSSNENSYVLWFKIAPANSEPINANTLGKIFVEVDIQGLTTNDSVAGKTASALTNASVDFEIVLAANVINLTAITGGNITDISASITGVSVSTLLNGEVSEGIFSNATVTFVIPDGITTNFFYQLYRTITTTVTTGLLISDIDPGDEMNLVYEDAVTTLDLSNGNIIIDDITPETFRNSGAALYTNPVSGSGILQANDNPPFAKDIELFRNSMFYSNTKSAHKLEFSLLSVIDFTSGVSQFVIGNTNVARVYTFVGTKEVTTLTCANYVNTLETNANNSYILLNSANDETKYYIWFNKGTAVDPEISGRIGIVVNLTDLTGATAPTIAQRVYDTLLEFSDFDVTILSNVLTITNVNNGPSVNATTGTGVPSTDIGTGWALGIVSGTGEDYSIQQVLLSGLPSAAQAIEETARSLIYAINQDSSSPVIASYLSSENDLPGKILFENKSLADNPFYLAVSDFAITQKFSPTLTETQSIVKIKYSIGAGSPAKINKVAHGLSTGTSIYIDSPSTTPAINGIYSITVIDVDNFTIPENILTEDDPSTAAFYFLPSAAISDNLVSPNRIYFSKTNQPEAVPLVNYVDVGSKDEAIERIIALRDNLFVFKTDGIYILSGNTAPNFSVKLLDNSTIITAPDSAAVLNNQIYCLSTQGIITVSDTGVSILSRDIENLVLDVANARFNYRYTTFGVAYENDRSYMLWLPSTKVDTVATQCYRFNTFERTWTKWTISATCGKVLGNDDKLYLGNGDRNIMSQERKNDDRTDFSDRNFTLSIGSAAMVNNDIRLSSTSSVEIGDVLYQDQYITISQYNRLLRKLDLDRNLDTDYESSLLMNIGDNIVQSLNNLNAKLVLDDLSGIVTVKAFSVTPQTMQTQFNTLIDELNNSMSDTRLKDYNKIETTTSFETIITAVNNSRNTITASFVVPFQEGTIVVYKAIKSVIQWQPLHFGDPSGLKQIREATVMFDQNNFYGATLSFATDLSQSLYPVPFLSKGLGYWGYGTFSSEYYYWGGEGNDTPFRTIVPIEKQRCRYITMKYEHSNAREKWRILGITAVVRAVSSRAYR